MYSKKIHLALVLDNVSKSRTFRVLPNADYLTMG